MCDKSINQIRPYYYAIVKCIWHIIILDYTVLIINIVFWVTLSKAQIVQKYFSEIRCRLVNKPQYYLISFIQHLLYPIMPLV